MPETLTLEEMSAKLETLEKQGKEFEEYKANTTKQIQKYVDEISELKAAKEHKKGSEEKEEEKKARKERRATFHKHMKAAEEETDEEKKKEHIAEAMKHYKAEDGEAEEEDEEKEDNKDAALKAEVTFLRGLVTKPMIKFLNASYKNRVEEDVLKSYTANWSKMSPSQLEAEIKKVQPFVANSIRGEITAEEPIGFGTMPIPQEFAASDKDDYSAELEKKSVQELFA